MIARLDIQTAARNGITYLKQSYCTPPFKVANITEDKKAGPLHLMLMSASPGILDGDDYQLQINVGEHSQLHLHTQSYQRLFNMKTGACQCMALDIQQGASFIYVPHPAVPHEQSVFTSRNKVYLHHNSRLIWGELLTCGRKLNGEQFSFSKYHSITDIYLNECLVIKENLLVVPALIKVQAIGQWEGYTHQASLIIIDEPVFIKVVNEIIYDYLLQQKDITFGISIASDIGLIVRVLGYKAEQLYNCLNAIAACITTNKYITGKTTAAC
jgi:urease accessory protein